MTANSFIAVGGRPSAHEFRHAFQGTGELLLALNTLSVIKVMGLALLPRFNYPLSILWAHTNSCWYESKL